MVDVERLLAARVTQGLPQHVEDEAALEHVAAVVTAAVDRDQRQPRTSRTPAA
jgi:hypothetical protein